MPVSVYKRLFEKNSFTQHGPVQIDLKEHNVTGMNLIGSFVLYHHAHKLTEALKFNITVIEVSVLLSCVDILAPELVLASDKLDKISQWCQADRYDVYGVSRKVQDNPSVNKQSQSDEINQAVVLAKENLLRLFSDCYTV